MVLLLLHGIDVDLGPLSLGVPVDGHDGLHLVETLGVLHPDTEPAHHLHGDVDVRTGDHGSEDVHGHVVSGKGCCDKQSGDELGGNIALDLQAVTDDGSADLHGRVAVHGTRLDSRLVEGGEHGGHGPLPDGVIAGEGDHLVEGGADTGHETQGGTGILDIDRLVWHMHLLALHDDLPVLYGDLRADGADGIHCRLGVERYQRIGYPAFASGKCREDDRSVCVALGWRGRDLSLRLSAFECDVCHYLVSVTMVSQGSFSAIYFPVPFRQTTATAGPVPDMPAANAPSSSALSMIAVPSPVTLAMSLPFRVSAFRGSSSASLCISSISEATAWYSSLDTFLLVYSGVQMITS